MDEKTPGRREGNATGSSIPAAEQKPQNRSRYILLNTLSSYARDIVDTITFLVLIPFIIKTLGSDSFGLWSLIWSFLALFELADLGFGASVVKYVADARGREDITRQKKIVCTLFWIYVMLGGLVMLGVMASILFFDWIFQIPSDQALAARSVLIILGARSALYLPMGMFRGVLAGHQKMKIDNWYKILGNLLYFASVLILLSRIPDLRVLAALNLITGVLPLLAMVAYVKRTAPEISVHPRYFDRTLVPEVSSFSMYFSFIQIAGLIATRADALIIKLFLPLQFVAIYSIGMRLAENASHFCSHLTRVLSPVVAELHGAAEQANVRAVWYRGTKITAAFATPLLLGLALLAPPLIEAWTGPDFKTAVPVCRWLTAAAMVNVFHGGTVNILSMGGHQRFLAFAMMGGQALNLLLSFLLIHSYGIEGVAMATFLSYVPLYIGIIQTHAGRIHRCSLFDFYRTTIAPVVLPALIMSALFALIQQYWMLTHLLEVALVEALGIVVFAASFWLMGFSSKERTYFREKVPLPLLRR